MKTRRKPARAGNANEGPTAKCDCWDRERTRWSRGFAWLNGEVLLRRWPNCGTVIAFRSLWSSVVICATSLLLVNLIDPNRIYQFNGRELQLQLLAGLPWFATVLAASYAAFYTRFSAQWSYLAELYNSIKSAQCSCDNDLILDEWKAAFLEDCEDLHLSRKASFATTLHVWGSDPHVQNAFVEHAIGGRHRLASLLCLAAIAANRAAVTIDPRPRPRGAPSSRNQE